VPASQAVFFALGSTYGYLSPELWKPHALVASPYDEHATFLKSGKSDAPKPAPTAEDTV
jgi:hypothetical protein